MTLHSGMAVLGRRAVSFRPCAVVRRFQSTKVTVPAHFNFRSFVDALRDEHEFVDIDEEVDPKLEVAAIMRRAHERRAKAPLFNKVIGAHDGLFRILGAPGGLSKEPEKSHRRLALHLGREVGGELDCVLDEVAGGGKEGPDELDEAGHEVRHCADD